MRKFNRRVLDLNGQNNPAITSEVSFNSATNEAIVEYKTGGLTCPSIKLTSAQANIFAGYSLVRKDLKFCIKLLNLALDYAKKYFPEGRGSYVRDEFDSEADILKSLYISLVVTYGKCFTQAKGRKVKLELSEMFSKEEIELKELHLELMEQRHQYVAHAGVTLHEKAQAILILHPDQEAGLPPVLTTMAQHTSTMDVGYYKQCLNLLDHVDKKVSQIVTSKGEALTKSVLAETSLEQLYTQART
ncbi:hypothetical protein AB6D65_18480 [Vibrio alginolyticus]|uniref:hypothetical protein n=1 Tax=Vibrio alginolyticus TaxID=663 RepID=UPI0021D0078A